MWLVKRTCTTNHISTLTPRYLIRYNDKCFLISFPCTHSDDPARERNGFRGDRWSTCDSIRGLYDVCLSLPIAHEYFNTFSVTMLRIRCEKRPSQFRARHEWRCDMQYYLVFARFRNEMFTGQQHLLFNTRK